MVTPVVPARQNIGSAAGAVMKVNDSTREAIHIQQLEVGMEMVLKRGRATADCDGCQE